MSISRQSLSVIIVSFKSDHVIHRCIGSIDKQIEIIVIDNSNSPKFKKNIEEKYENVKCILSQKNVGMGAGNNIGIKHIDKDFAFILNPDIILGKSAIDEIINASKTIDSFGVIAPISDNIKYPNYKFDKNKNDKFDLNNPFKVKSVDGYAMLLNLKKLRHLNNFNFFDENFFLYLENDDLCKRLGANNEDIYIIPKSKISHLGGEAVDLKYEYEVELSRNWHWIWSKFYFNKKHFNYTKAFMDGFPKFFLGLIKYSYYSLIRNKKKQKICLNRVSGFFNAALNKPSWYRPNIKL